MGRLSRILHKSTGQTGNVILMFLLDCRVIGWLCERRLARYIQGLVGVWLRRQRCWRGEGGRRSCCQPGPLGIYEATMPCWIKGPVLCIIGWPQRWHTSRHAISGRCGFRERCYGRLPGDDFVWGGGRLTAWSSKGSFGKCVRCLLRF